MASLTIYLEDDVLRKLKKAAARDNSSMSGWAKKHLVEAAEPTDSNGWPVGHFDKLRALATDDTFQAPEESEIPLRDVSFD